MSCCFSSSRWWRSSCFLSFFSFLFLFFLSFFFWSFLLRFFFLQFFLLFFLAAELLLVEVLLLLVLSWLEQGASCSSSAGRVSASSSGASGPGRAFA